MKILHTADWHLGKRIDRFSRLEEQKIVLAEIIAIADQQEVDAVIIAGDLFDAFNPPVEAIELLYSTLKKLTNNGQRPVIAIAGNHDSPERIDSPDALALECGIIFMGYPNQEIRKVTIENGFSISRTDKGFIEIQLPNSTTPLRIIATPYANEIRLKEYFGEEKEIALQTILQQQWQQLADKYCDNQGVNLLTTHLYMLKRGGEILEEPDGEKPLKIGNADLLFSDAIPPQIQYTALGHLHRYQNVGSSEKPVIYSSSPLQYSFSEAGQEKFVSLIHAAADQAVKLEKIALTSGHTFVRKRFHSCEDAIQWLTENPSTYVELTIVSDTFLGAEDLRNLRQAHSKIVYIIPQITSLASENHPASSVNLSQSMDELFQDYFHHKYGQAPNEDILALFKEISNK